MVRVAVVALLTLVVGAGAATAQDSASTRTPPREPSTEPVAVIVNARTPVQSVDRATLRRIFLVRQRLWPGGSRATPVNLPAGSLLREQFSRMVLGSGSRDLAGYWNDLYFHGTLPPPTLASEQAVLLYVARTPGAVGYVSQRSLGEVPAGVRVVLVL